MKRLGVSLPETCGVLELLWHFTAAYTPAGDIGRYTDVAITDGIGWKGDPSKLIEDLAGAGFLDVCADCRYIVHHWSEHCDDATHMKLARELRTFADGTEPRQNRLSLKERAALEKKRTTRAHTVRTESALPRPAPPRHEVETDPPQTPPASAGGARARTKAQAATIADQLAARYRERLGKAPGGRLVRHWRTELRQGVSEGAIGALIEALAAEEQRQAAANAAEQARWGQAQDWVERHGGLRLIARAALDWVERNRGPDESVDQALARWCREGGFPHEVLVLAVRELYQLRREGRGERSPPAPAGKAASEPAA